MEKASSASAIEMYQQDIDELTDFIQKSTRPNNKRFLEEHKKNLIILLEKEKKILLEQEKKNSENKSTTQEPQQFVSISKYAFDSGDKFVK